MKENGTLRFAYDLNMFCILLPRCDVLYFDLLAESALKKFNDSRF